MAGSLKGSQTEKNLLAAFAGESQARNRYTYFASAARKAGYEQIANIFMETAENEKEHANVFFKYLEGGEVTITEHYPAGSISDTRANLQLAGDGELFEWGTIYPQFAAKATAEGLPDVAQSFTQIATVEKFHEARYRKLASNLDNGQVFDKPATTKWHCINCGYISQGARAPAACPACKHPRAFYELLAENW
jgi:rubrerythrin